MSRVPTVICVRCGNYYYEDLICVQDKCVICNTGSYFIDTLPANELDHARDCNSRGYADA